MRPEQVSQINNHLAYQVETHPVFCSGMTDDVTYRTVMNVIRRGIEDLEVSLKSDDLRHMRGKIFDVIADLIRLDDEIVMKMCRDDELNMEGGE